MNASKFNSPPSSTKKIIEFPEREITPEEHKAKRERLRAYNKTLRARWRGFWCDIADGRLYWRRSVWRVWGTDPQGQKHYLGMESADTPEKAIEVRRAIGVSRDPRVLAYKISATRLPEDRSLGERIGNFISLSGWTIKESVHRWALFASRVAIFVALLYAIDRTPLDASRLVGYFHLGPVAAWFLALAALVLLWRVGNGVTGLLLLLGALALGVFAKEKAEVRKRTSHEQ
jgi:hypothetical protein